MGRMVEAQRETMEGLCDMAYCDTTLFNAENKPGKRARIMFPSLFKKIKILGLCSVTILHSECQLLKDGSRRWSLMNMF